MKDNLRGFHRTIKVDLVHLVKEKISSKSKTTSSNKGNETKAAGDLMIPGGTKPNAVKPTEPPPPPQPASVPKTSVPVKEIKKEDKKMTQLRSGYYRWVWEWAFIKNLFRFEFVLMFVLLFPSRIELNRTVWEIPEKYQNLTPVGTGAYGQVWFVPQSITFSVLYCFSSSNLNWSFFFFLESVRRSTRNARSRWPSKS